MFDEFGGRCDIVAPKASTKTCSQKYRKREHKKMFLKASAAVRMRFPPRQELDFYVCSSQRFGIKNDTGLETCPDPKHEKIHARGHEVGIMLQIIRKLFQSELEYPHGYPPGYRSEEHNV